MLTQAAALAKEWCRDLHRGGAPTLLYGADTYSNLANKGGEHMSFSDVTALAVLALSGVVFYLLASRSQSTKLTLLGYTHADRQIDSSRFGASLVAASTSLATVLLFFLAAVNYYGILLLWCGVTYFVGHFIFIRYVKDKPVLKKDIRTVSDLWYDAVRSRLNARLITGITVLSFLVILFVELYIGSRIVGYFIEPYYPAVSGVVGFGFVSLLVIGYVRIGGLRGVMNTDRWQLTLMLASIGALGLFSILATSPPAVSESVLAIPPPGAAGTAPSFFQLRAGLAEALLFCFWILVHNLAGPFSQLSSWQRVASAKSGSDAWKGFKQHRKNLLFVWIIPVLAFTFLMTKGFSFTNLAEFLDAVKGEGGICDGVLYPVIVLGFGSALFSTADTALIGLGTALADKNTFGVKLEKLSGNQLRNVFSVFSLIALALLAFVYYLAEANLGSWFMPLIYAIFGQLVVVSPLILYSLVKAPSVPLDIGRAGELLIAAGLILAWLMIIGAVFIDQALGTSVWSQFAAPASFVVSGVLLLLGIRLGRASVSAAAPGTSK